jgi:hypothetical protein
MSRKSNLPINPENGLPITNKRIGSDEAAVLKQKLTQFNDAPTGMKRIICLSPLAKLFQPYSDIERFLDDPSSVYNDEDFDIVFENSWATKNYKYGESYLVSDLEALYLVGVDNNRFERSSGATGFVYFNIPEDLLSAFSYMKKTGKKADKEIEDQLNGYLKNAKDLSNKRVLDFMKDKYNLLFQNRQFVESQGGKAMNPNDMEILITFVLNEDIKRSNSKRKVLRKAWEDANREISGQ